MDFWILDGFLDPMSHVLPYRHRAYKFASARVHLCRCGSHRARGLFSGTFRDIVDCQLNFWVGISLALVWIQFMSVERNIGGSSDLSHRNS